MMEQVAKVIGTDSDGWVKVQVELKSACNHCSSSESCGTSAVAKAFGSRLQEFSLPSTETYPEGTLLRLGLPESVVLKAALLVYMLPLAGLFMGGLLGRFVASLAGFSTDGGAISMAIAFALLAWQLGKSQARRIENRAQPFILANLGQAMESASETHRH
ncbi:SoxR reducing system RseC family protein [Shewanella algae]|uniref:SoxR reducing system RseC family protein n=1 Tax=Shewanella algae TaxID=38313 RepID=UPI003007153E